MIDKIVDLYHGDEVPGENWAAVAAGGTVAIIHKASQGLGNIDHTYALRRVKATRAGLLWGAYHFATYADGAQQADNFLQCAQPEPSTLMALDLERNPTGPTVTLQQARDFITRIHAVTGRYPWIYGSDIVAEFAGPHGDAILSKCPLWIARYGHAPVVPPGWSKWTLWQYAAGESNADRLPGLNAADRNRFDGTLDELKAIWSA